MYYLIGFVSHTTLMGYYHDGHSLVLVQLLEQLHHLDGGLGVEGTRRLVGQDNLGLGNQRSGNGHTLLLSTGELVGIVLSPIEQSQFIQVFQRKGVPLLTRHPLIEKWQLNIFNCGLE